MKSSRKFTVVVVDDESPARKLLRYLLSKEPDFEIVRECENGREAVKAIRADCPDLALLDIQMPDMDGFDVIRRLETTSLPHVVFVTAFNDYAVRAFEVHALDYILKPPTPARFAESINRVRKLLRSGKTRNFQNRYNQLIKDIEYHSENSKKAEAGPAQKPNYLKQFVVRSKQGMSTIAVQQVDWIEAADHYAYIYFKGVKQLVEKSLSELEQILDPGKFLRIRRNVIVNLKSIANVKIARFGSMEIALDSGDKFKTSRFLSARYRKLLIMQNSVSV